MMGVKSVSVRPLRAVRTCFTVTAERLEAAKMLSMMGMSCGVVSGVGQGRAEEEMADFGDGAVGDCGWWLDVRRSLGGRW